MESKRSKIRSKLALWTPVYRIQVVGILAIYIFWGIGLDFYTLKVDVPKREELHRSEGTIELKKVPRGGYRTYLYTAVGEISFSCSAPHGGGECLSDPGLSGQHAIVWWYWQANFPFIRVRRPAVIVSGQRVLLSYEKARKHVEVQKGFVPFRESVLLAMVIIGLYVAYRFELRRKKVAHELETKL